LQRPGLVVDQRPRTGYRSSYDKIMLVVTKATQGVIPNLVGENLNQARLRLKRLKIEPTIRWTVGKPGRVVSQKPRPGLAAAPGVKVELVVAKATANVEAAG
jgi:beta-lactam-binding protein with PASTA domain